MDEFLSLIGAQAMKYAIRSGIVLTSNYALDQCSRLIDTLGDKKAEIELKNIQNLMDSKIKVLSPAIDLIELKSGRGNVFLESALPITKSLHEQIMSLGREIETITSKESKEDSSRGKTRLKNGFRRHERNIRDAVASIKCLLEQIDRCIPLLNLAITASGESLSTSLPSTVSPSRLLQASTFLVIGDSQFAKNSSQPVQIGPTFCLSIYMLFLSHCTQKDNTIDSCQPIYGLGENETRPMWQETIHKAHVRLFRCKHGESAYGEGAHQKELSSNHRNQLEYQYFLVLDETFNDGRFHSEDQSDFTARTPSPLREHIPIQQLSKIFYTDKAKLLNIGDPASSENRPILLLKRDINVKSAATESLHSFTSSPTGAGVHEAGSSSDAQPPIACPNQSLIDLQLHNDSPVTHNVAHIPISSPRSNLPSHLDPEWLAMEMFVEDGEDDQLDGESEEEEDIEHCEETLQFGAQNAKSVHSSTEHSDFSSRLDGLIIEAASRPDSTKASTKSLNCNSSQSMDHGADQARSPFNAITTSLSLLEMMIRLTGLQEYQQKSHLSIPDHILSFFLEETSTAGLSDPAKNKLRRQTKQQAGYDPYTDDAAE